MFIIRMNNTTIQHFSSPKPVTHEINFWRRLLWTLQWQKGEPRNVLHFIHHVRFQTLLVELTPSLLAILLLPLPYPIHIHPICLLSSVIIPPHDFLSPFLIYSLFNSFPLIPLTSPPFSSIPPLSVPFHSIVLPLFLHSNFAFSFNLPTSFSNFLFHILPSPSLRLPSLSLHHLTTLPICSFPSPLAPLLFSSTFTPPSTLPHLCRQALFPFHRTFPMLFFLP